MVFQFLNFFKKNKNQSISLYINNTKQKDITTVNIKSDSLLFSDTIEIPLTQIQNIHSGSSDEFQTSEISFKHNNNFYLMIANYDLINFLEELKNELKPKNIIFNAKIDYYAFNSKNSKFDLIEKDCSIKLITEEIKNFLRIDAKDKLIIHLEEINNNLFRSDPSEKAFIWSLKVKKLFLTFKIIFESNVDFLEFLSKYVKLLTENNYEAKNLNEVNDDNINEAYKKEANKIEVNNNKYNNECNKSNNYLNESEVTSKYLNNIMYTNKNISFIDNSNENLSYNTDYSDIFDSSSTSEEQNNYLCIGKENNAFITKENELNIYSIDYDNIKYKNTVKQENLNPKKIIQRDNSLLILNKENNEKIQKLDLERGEIVDEWNLKRNLNDYFENKKMENSVIGIDNNSIFMIDERMKNKIGAENVYKTNVNFSCGIANNEEMAIASKKGDLRLYNKFNKKARVLLPGFGDECLGIDSSLNGKFVVCTFNFYLLLYVFEEKSERPEPIRLQLKNEHLVFMNEEISFTPAKFSINASNESIVTSTGRFVVIWQLSDVLSGNVFDYSIKKCKNKVVADNFGIGSENVVVALPNEVKIIRKNKMKNPEKIIRKRIE
ncbi:Vacuolar import and degradation protein 27 [Gurleya vavrai]